MSAKRPRTTGADDEAGSGEGDCDDEDEDEDEDDDGIEGDEGCR